MARRFRIGIPFTYDKTWVAGAYYIQNLIEALNLLPDNEKPQLIIFYDDPESLSHIQKIDYPYIRFYLTSNLFKSIPIRVINKLSRIIIKN